MKDSENTSGMLMVVIFSVSMVLLLFVLYFIVRNILIVILCYFIDQRKKVALIEIKEKDSATTKSRYKKFHIYNIFVFIVNDVGLLNNLVFFSNLIGSFDDMKSCGNGMKSRFLLAPPTYYSLENSEEMVLSQQNRQNNIILFDHKKVTAL